MRILVTGGSGFIGTKLVEALINQGHEAVIYDKRKSESYSDLCIIGDIRDRTHLASSMRGIQAVYHLAAEHRDDVRPSSLYYEVNVGGAENLIYGLKENHIDRLIFTSSVAVYGLDLCGANEESPPKPFNDYGRSKHKSEDIFRSWALESDDRSLVIVRPTVIFGEGNRGNVYELIKQVASKKFIMIGSGKNRKSMGYVRNLVQFVIKTLSLDPGIRVFNYADKPDLTTNQLIEIITKELENNPKIRLRLPFWVGLAGGYAFDLLAIVMRKKFSISSVRIKKFCSDTVVSVDRLSEIGFKAPTSLTEGLSRMIRSDFCTGNA